MNRCVKIAAGFALLFAGLPASGMPLGVRTMMQGRAAIRQVVEGVPSDVIPSVAGNASAEVVTNAINTVGFADPEVKIVIGGSVEEYTSFKNWAGNVKNFGGTAAAGEAAVVANTNAAAAYLLGAERLFVNAPKIEFGAFEIHSQEVDIPGQGGNAMQMSVSVIVKDGEDPVKCDAEKVAAMFEATSDLGDWAGGGRVGSGGYVDHALSVEVMIKEGDGATMRFKVTPVGGTAQKAFLRMRR